MAAQHKSPETAARPSDANQRFQQSTGSEAVRQSAPMTHDLFSYPHVPGSKTGGTSRESAEAMKPTAATLRGECLNYVKRWASVGSTADECAEYLNQTVLSIRPRFSELRALNLIVDSGVRRANVSGHRAIVWRAM